MEYTTQMDAARKGIITKEMEAVAKKEYMDIDELVKLVACGKIIIPANKNHKCLEPTGIGSMLRTKINVNLGTSRDCVDLDMELDKVNNAVKMGAEAIMDLSSFGDTRKFRKKLTTECPAIIGTVPIYDAVVYYHKALKDITAKEWLDIVRMHAEDGVDFMTIHCGINKATAKKFRADKRLMNIVSRGGSIIYAWMEMTGNENPFFEYYDEVLDICREYDVTMSLGDACRPGCIMDASDISQIEELVTLGFAFSNACLNVRTSDTSGIMLLLLCLAALSDIEFHLAIFVLAFLSSSFTTLLFIATGNISYTPSSTIFWIISSILSDFGSP